MSFSGDQAQSFFTPLWGRTATFLLDERESNLQFARTIVALAGCIGEACSILDLDALYSADANATFSRPADSEATRILLPPPGAEVEVEFPKLFEAQQRVIIVDSLNSLYHLLSQADARSRSRKLTFAVESLSYLARKNNKAAVLTMYRREWSGRQGRSRPISRLSDITAEVEIGNGELSVRSERGSAWSGGRFSTRIP